VTVDLTRKDRREWHDFQEDVTGKTEDISLLTFILGKLSYF
jgi:hypothetical protein